MMSVCHTPLISFKYSSKLLPLPLTKQAFSKAKSSSEYKNQMIRVELGKEWEQVQYCT